MNIIPVVPRGYCKGVVKAIALAKKTKEQYPDTKVTMLGMIVHNQYVVDACANLGIECIDDPNKSRVDLLNDINEGVVIFTAHGVSEEVYNIAKQKGLIIVDATCVDVLKTHDIVKEHLSNGGDVLFIGKRNHPEAEGICSLSSRIHLIENQDDLDTLDNLHDVLITNQTTMSIVEIRHLIDDCLKKYPDAKITQEICNATRMRQEAIQNLKNVNVLIVVGDPRSNNTQKLASIGEASIPKVITIENANQLDVSLLKEDDTIAITSGASTPTYLTDMVIDKLNKLANHEVMEDTKIDVNQILD